ncbi:MAG: M23 family metallopeptidase [Clostridia bacterium]|nr:M23 family metallopeptidase [Clostridia bacterium]
MSSKRESGYERYESRRRQRTEGMRTYERGAGSMRKDEEKAPMSFAKKTAVRFFVCVIIFLLALALKNAHDPAAERLRETISDTLGATTTAEDVEVFASGVSSRIGEIAGTTVAVFSGREGAVSEEKSDHDTQSEEKSVPKGSYDTPKEEEAYDGEMSVSDYAVNLSSRKYTEMIEPLSDVELFGAATEAYDCDTGEAREELPSNVCNDNLILPIKLIIPVDRHVTSKFGPRINPVTKKESFHYGVDLGAPEGYAVLAPADGVVAKVSESEAYGINMIIHHDHGIGTFYGHLSEVLVSEGESVSAGQTVARVGSTGWSTGPHLHFELHKDMMILNPENYFEFIYD